MCVRIRCFAGTKEPRGACVVASSLMYSLCMRAGSVSATCKSHGANGCGPLLSFIFHPLWSGLLVVLGVARNAHL